MDLTSEGWAKGWADRDKVAQADAKRAERNAEVTP